MSEAKSRRSHDEAEEGRSPKRARTTEDILRDDTVESRSKHKSKSHKSSAGFKWKSKGNDEEQDEERERDKAARREARREEKARRKRDQAGEDEGTKPRTQVDDPGEVGKTKTLDASAQAEIEEEDADIAAKFGPSYKSSSRTKVPPASETTQQSQSPASTKPRSSKPKAAAVPTGPMILVKINDRLGTTSRVPALPSDTVGDFKKLVAMRIGRKPHEIMLKRQSERPFKDFLTLADYGVSDGVQLDLELDTGD